MDPQTLFLTALTVLFAVYTAMAMDMEWTSTSGRIAAGFFPRIIGFLALLLCVIALARSVRRSLRQPAAGEAPQAYDLADDDGAESQHPKALLAVILCSIAFYAAFMPLGAWLSAAVFLFAALSFLNQRRHVVNIAVAVLLPALLYLLFSQLLDVGLPGGFLNLS
ncbi:tripartite tricarboxylate transporter TctB family protein [Kibdelosporangium aridum]|uniref:Tripartite tricarboxylate transporter TctB family protein n=1 Tax=Kibdelosporangium aridum TaxID=2030 RepID=A0A1Y5Y051_KIBAR|nr:tripartite tricarboxylate transporter TctB family protein [Kibdelosporangium aridum]SMD22937.1 Tripartite tricarboxylate transporter TctB family protein [Kibdelosporangium aridum]